MVHALSIINQLNQKYEKITEIPKMPPELGYHDADWTEMLKIMFGVWKQD